MSTLVFRGDYPDFGGTSGNVGKLASMAKGGAGLATKVGASFMK